MFLITMLLVCDIEQGVTWLWFANLRHMIQDCWPITQHCAIHGVLACKGDSCSVPALRLPHLLQLLSKHGDTVSKRNGDPRQGVTHVHLCCFTSSYLVLIFRFWSMETQQTRVYVGQRRKRWASIVPTLSECLVFAGKAVMLWFPRGKYPCQSGGVKSQIFYQWDMTSFWDLKTVIFMFRCVFSGQTNKTTFQFL